MHSDVAGGIGDDGAIDGAEAAARDGERGARAIAGFAVQFCE